MQSAATAPQQCRKRLPRQQGGTRIGYAKKYAGKTPSIIIIPNLRRAGKSEITEIVCFLKQGFYSKRRKPSSNLKDVNPV